MKHGPSYKPISDYGVIGNLRSVALIARNGDIDWWCAPEMSSPSVFAALLDARRGGSFRITAEELRPLAQHYIPDTNILKTTLQNDNAQLHVVDLMPLNGRIDGRGDSQARPEIIRILTACSGDLAVTVEWAPRMDYARATVRIEPLDDRWIASGGGNFITLSAMDEARVHEDEHGPTVRGVLHLQRNQPRVLATRWNSRNLEASPGSAQAALDQTTGIWRRWAHGRHREHREKWAGNCGPLLDRSALVLRLLTHGETGAMAAAATMGLPMRVGADCNYDYRYSWIRDLALTAQALVGLGHEKEALEAMQWAERIATKSEQWELPVMYGLHGEVELGAQNLNHLEGYRASRPIAFGNPASGQFQLEIYGELLNTAYELARRGTNFVPEVIDHLAQAADHVQEVWQRPDSGIWELHEPSQLVYSKVMAWVALDRALHLARHVSMPGNHDQWKDTARQIRQWVLEKGFNGELGAFVMRSGSMDMDAANLRIPLLEFLPADDVRVLGTVDRIMERLLDNGLVYRFEVDGKRPTGEAGFALCTFWLIDALSLCGRIAEARELLDRMAARANHLLLLSEQFDPLTGEMLGNFPQAFAHIGLVNSALYLAHAKGREIPGHAPIGTQAHRQSVEREG